MKKSLTRPTARRQEPARWSDASPRAKPAEPAHPAAAVEVDPWLARLAANRVVIENVAPEIDGGRFPAKAAAGDCFTVEADIFADGHDKIDAAFLIRRADQEEWQEH